MKSSTKPQAWTLSPQMTAAPELWRGIYGFWALWEGSGVSVRDLAQRNDGTLNNMNSPWVLGTHGRSLSFDGSDDYISVPNQETGLSNPYTFNAWVFLPDLDADYCVWQGRGGVSANHILWMDFEGADKGYRFYDQEGGSTSADVGGAVANIWQMVTVTKDENGNLDLYTDTSLTDSVTLTDDVRTSEQHFGRQIQGEKPLKGEIDLVSIYDRVLLTDEIKFLYNDPYAMLRPAGF